MSIEPDEWRYPFGRPVGVCTPSASGPRRVLVLGAYPSALHVAWQPPAGGGRPIQALPVDDEPEPFWDGVDVEARVDRWREHVGFSSNWGQVTVPDERFNGGSGRPIEPRYLLPLGLTRADAWITDCLNTYRASEGVSSAVASVYSAFARGTGLPPAHLAPHPDELEIVSEACRDHAGRLAAEIEAASPDAVITLGNAALKVLWSLPGVRPGTADAPVGLTPRDYGRPVPVRVGRRRMTLWALGHPNILRTNDAYAASHDLWMHQPTIGAQLGR